MVEIVKMAYEHPVATCFFILCIGMSLPTIRFKKTKYDDVTKEKEEK